MDDEPNFQTMDHKLLADYARQMYQRLQTMHDQVQMMQQDRKDAIVAYRNLVKEIVCPEQMTSK